jgi:hypothetical protein
MTRTTPREIDTELAELFNRHYAAEDRLASFNHSILQTAGAEFYYRGRRRVTDLRLDEAIERLETELAKHDDDDYGYGRLSAPCSGSSSTGNARRALEGRLEKIAELERLDAEIAELEELYTGWSRFFLVTSSPGHVHRSTHCSTCRPTTRFGWLPELSGKSDEVAVDELGPTLCTVCYPDAPVEWTEGKKITAAQAAKRAA